MTNVIRMRSGRVFGTNPDGLVVFERLKTTWYTFLSGNTPKFKGPAQLRRYMQKWARRSRTSKERGTK